jgi:hypothetical protein
VEEDAFHLMHTRRRERERRRRRSRRRRRRRRKRDRRGRRRGHGQDTVQEPPHPCDLLPLARPYLLKFPEPPKIASPAGDLAFNK